MKTNEKGKGCAPGMRTLGLLAIMGLCCMALVPAVAADKWLVTNTTVYANTSPYATINGVEWGNDDFFGVVGNGHYNLSVSNNEAYVWNQSTVYSNRYYMDKFRKVTTLYPSNLANLGDFNWEFVSDLTPTATLYKKGLGGYVNYGVGGTYYAWYGNRTYATSGPYGNGSWFCPTYENATYVINLTVQWGP